MTPPVPQYITVDSVAVDLFVHGKGVVDCVPLAEKEGESVLYQQQWEQWTSQHRTVFKWPTFVELFKAQSNDDTPASLSIEDLQFFKISGSTKVNAEKALAEVFGYPEAIIQDKNREVLRMSDGSFWAGEKKVGLGYVFIQIARAEGKETETRVAREILQRLDAQFSSGDPSTRLRLKSTAPILISSGSGYSKSFADKEYLLGNSNSEIAYRADGDLSRYFLLQPQNGCVAAAILNGNIFSGNLKGDDPTLLDRLYRKFLNSPFHGGFGRIDTSYLITYIQEGNIPGVTARVVDESEIEQLVEGKKPVIALVPYFSGHAWAVNDVDVDAKTYTAIDTVSGMVVNSLLDASKEQNEVDQLSEEMTRRESEQFFAELKQMQADQEQSLSEGEEIMIFPILWSQISPRPAVYIPRSFFTVEITNVEEFIAWLPPSREEQQLRNLREFLREYGGEE